MGTSDSSKAPPPWVVDEEKMCEGFKDMLSALPTEKGWGDVTYYQYQGFWYPTWQLQIVTECQRNFVAKDSDILLASSPKCGTTWLKALAFAILNRMRYPPTDEQHPVNSKNPHALVPFLEEVVNDSNSIPDDHDHRHRLHSSTSPRLVASHIPYASLPTSVKDSDCKLIYVCRNPKGAFASYWNFVNRIREWWGLGSISLNEGYDAFCKGVTDYGPIWDHALQYWKESLEKPNKILFLKYEELMEEPSLHVKRIAEFMGCPISDDEEALGVADEIVRLCSFNHLSNLEVNKSGRARGIPSKAFFWKGKVENSKNYLTPDMIDGIDALTAKKLQGSGIEL